MIAMQRLLRYSYEGFSVYLILMLFYVYSKSLPPVIPFIIVYLLPAFVMLVLMIRLEKVSVSLLWLLIPVFVVISWLMGFSLLVAVCLAVFCIWRGCSYFFIYIDFDDGPNELFLLLGGLAVAVVSFILFSVNNPYNGIFLLVIVLEFVFLLAMKLVDRLGQATSADAEQKQTALKWGGGTLGALVVVSLLFLLLYPAVKWLFMAVFGIVGTALGWVIAYPMFWIVALFMSLGSPETAHEYLTSMRKSNYNHPKQPHPTDSATSFPVEWIWILLICAFLVALVWFIRKKIKLDRVANTGMTGTETRSTSFIPAIRKRKNSGKPPKDQVRLRFYQLQGKLAACGFGRSENESVREWFSRFSFGAEEKKTVAAGYRKVRYGGESLSSDELSRYEKAVKALIQQAKEEKKKKD